MPQVAKKLAWHIYINYTTGVLCLIFISSLYGFNNVLKRRVPGTGTQKVLDLPSKTVLPLEMCKSKSAIENSLPKLV